MTQTTKLTERQIEELTTKILSICEESMSANRTLIWSDARPQIQSWIGEYVNG